MAVSLLQFAVDLIAAVLRARSEVRSRQAAGLQVTQESSGFVAAGRLSQEEATAWTFVCYSSLARRPQTCNSIR